MVMKSYSGVFIVQLRFNEEHDSRSTINLFEKAQIFAYRENLERHDKIYLPILN